MPIFNADETLFEPVTVVLCGKTYIVNEVTTEKIQKATQNLDMTDIKTVAIQTAVLLGTNPEELMGVDLRKLAMVNRFILDSFQAQLSDRKNVSGEGR